MELLKEARKIKPYLVRIRRELHMWPELGMEEFKTQKLIMRELKKIGIPFKKAVGTGVIGIIKGAKPGKSVLLRADIDALPIEEENKVPYRSKNKGVMHACGHDVHTANLLGAAKLLTARKKELQGSIKLVFQPREELRETPFDPAKKLVEQGVLRSPKVSLCVALHVRAGLKSGQALIVRGPVMANADFFEIRIKGVGAHGCDPHASKDPVYASACVIQALQSIISRTVPSKEAAVISVTYMRAGHAHNVIPPEAVIGGTTRTLNEKMNKLVQSSMKRVAEKTCEALGLKAEVVFKRGYPAFSNDEKAMDLFENMAVKVIGRKNVIGGGTSGMGGENFAYFGKGVPAAFVWLGVSKGKGQYPIHHPRFDVDEDCLASGAALLAGAALEGLKSKSL